MLIAVWMNAENQPCKSNIAGDKDRVITDLAYKPVSEWPNFFLEDYKGEYYIKLFPEYADGFIKLVVDKEK